MAEERQKRILIKEYDLACDLADCKYCEEQNWCSEKDGMTRQEAIERMAKALVEYERTNNPNACEWADLKERAKDIYRERAEAALNALLGD